MAFNIHYVSSLGELHAMALQQQQQQQSTMGPPLSHGQYQLPPPSLLSQTAPSHLPQAPPSHLPQQQQQQQNAAPVKQQQKSLSLGKVSGTEGAHGEQRAAGGQQKRGPPSSYRQNRPAARLLQQTSSGKLRQQEKEVMAGRGGKGKTRSQTDIEAASRGDRLRPLYSNRYDDSPDHSHHNSWAIDEEEDPDLRAEFPDVKGHLFCISLNKGKGGLGLNIVSETSSMAVRGIVIMGIQAGGVADKCGRIRWGDVILKMNNINVVGMSQEQFQKLLIQAPPTVTFVLLRQPIDPVNASQQVKWM